MINKIKFPDKINSYNIIDPYDTTKFCAENINEIKTVVNDLIFKYENSESNILLSDSNYVFGINNIIGGTGCKVATYINDISGGPSPYALILLPDKELDYDEFDISNYEQNLNVYIYCDLNNEISNTNQILQTVSGNNLIYLANPIEFDNTSYNMGLVSANIEQYTPSSNTVNGFRYKTSCVSEISQYNTIYLLPNIHNELSCKLIPMTIDFIDRDNNYIFTNTALPAGLTANKCIFLYGNSNSILISKRNEILQNALSEKELNISIGCNIFSTGNYNFSQGAIISTAGYCNSSNGLHIFNYGLGNAAFGANININGQCSFGAGSSLNINGDNSFAFGSSNNVDRDGGISIGHGNNCKAIDAITLGRMCKIYGYGGISIGTNSTVNGTSSISIGYNVTNNAKNALILGSRGTLPDLAENKGAIAFSGGELDDNGFGLIIRSYKAELNPLYPQQGEPEYNSVVAFSTTYKGRLIGTTQTINNTDSLSIEINHDYYDRWKITTDIECTISLLNWQDGDKGKLIFYNCGSKILWPDNWNYENTFQLQSNGFDVIEIEKIDDEIFVKQIFTKEK